MSAPKPLPAIKPCPFCGDKNPFAYAGVDDAYVFCEKPSCAGTRGPFRKNKRAAIMAWNRAASNARRAPQ